MCITLIAVSSVPSYPLIIAHNRDEYYARPAAQATWLNEGSVFGGQDLVHGGMWLGFSKAGHIALLTNYRDPSLTKKNAHSRGHLVRNFLEQGYSIPDFTDYLAQKSHNYNPFNIIFGKWSELHYYCSVDSAYKELSKGIYILSNGTIDCNWFKAQKLREGFTRLITENPVTTARILSLLLDQTLCPEEQLPSTGIPKNYELAISSIYVRTPEYGTRTSTVITVDTDGFASIEEVTSNPSGSLSTSKTEFKF